MSEFLRVAERLYTEVRRPMGPKELVELAFKSGLFSANVAGRTPHQTMKSKLSVDVRRKGSASRFVRTAPGKFYLRNLIGSGNTYDSPPQRKAPAHEQVLVFSGSRLHNRNRFQGIRLNWKSLGRSLLRPSACTFMDRLAAESDTTHKQILTYIMLTRKQRVLAYKRGSYNRVEDFLRGSHCIGFGGHVSRTDLNLFSMSDMGVRENAIRELSEELRLPTSDKKRLSSLRHLQIVGLLNDDSSVVGQRHFAVLFKYEVSDDAAWDRPERGEKSITQLRWVSPAGGAVPIWDFEYWSQLCLRQYFPRLASTVSQFRIIRRVPLRPPHLLCVLGEVGSGKSEATKLLTREYGFEEINSGRIVAGLLGIPPVPHTSRADFQKQAWQFISSPNGPDRLAAAIWEAACNCGRRVLVDGIRQSRTLNCLKAIAGKQRLGVLYVHTLPDLAFDFYRRREGKGRPVSIFEFLSVRSAEVEKEVKGLISCADAVLYNWTGRDQYRQAIRDLMHAILSEVDQ